MANNIISVPDLLIANSADVAGLQSMQDPIVTILKTFNPAGGKANKPLMILNGRTGLKVKDILALQDDVVDTTKFKNGGPGTYRFEVTDQASTNKVVWELRLGGQGEENQGTSAAPGGGASPRLVQPGNMIPLAPETENLGNGFIYNRKFNLLTVPDGRIFKWTPPDPLPDLNAVATAPSTPFHFGASAPATGPNPETEELRKKLAQMENDQRERQRQEELRELRESHQKQIEAVQSRFETLVEKLTAQPKVNTEVEDLKRMLADRDKQDALRAEINAKMEAMTNLVREVSANKGPDPMINVLMQMMTQQAQGAQETMRLMRESANTQLTTAQASSERFLTFMQHQAEAAKDSGSSVINEKFVGVLSGVMDTMLRVKETEARLAGGSGGPNWMDLLEKVTERGGAALNAIMQARAREAAAATAQANAKVVQARVIENAQAQRAADAARIAAVPPTAPVAPAPQTSEDVRDALAERMFPKPTPVAPTPAPAPTVAADAPAALASVTPIAPVRTVPAKRNKKTDPLAKATIEELRRVFNDKSDAEFFGEFGESIVELRDELTKDPNQYTADDVAQFVLDARAYIKDAVDRAGGKVPFVVDLLTYGKFDYIFERMLPERDEAFWREAATALQAKIIAERTTPTS